MALESFFTAASEVANEAGKESGKRVENIEQRKPDGFSAGEKITLRNLIFLLNK